MAGGKKQMRLKNNDQGEMGNNFYFKVFLLSYLLQNLPSNIQMKAVVFVLLVALAASYHVRTEHQYWYTANKGTAQSGVPFADVAWNYCDLKCVSFEKKYPGNDFYIINFKDAVYKPNFSACYVKAAGATTPDLWSKVAKNDFYEKNCGADTEDYLKNAAYSKINEEGVGIGVKIAY